MFIGGLSPYFHNVKIVERCEELKKSVDWSKIDKNDYLDAMMESPNSI